MSVSTDGTYAGTPTTAGIYTFTVTATNATGSTSSTYVHWVTTTKSVSLSTGWTLISLPLRPINPYIASSLATEISAQIAPAQISQVRRWVAGSWEDHFVGTPANDFPIDLGQGYFVKATAGGTWTAKGVPLSTISVAFPIGLSSVGGLSTGYTASSLAAALGPSITHVRRWDGTQWVTYGVGLPFNNFPIVPGYGYFFKANASGSVELSTAP
jgi:PKD repeat protein